MSVSKIFVMGQVDNEPQLKLRSQGLAVCYLSVATTEVIKQEKHTIWFQVVLFGTQAELAKKQLIKGSNVYVEGRLKVRELKDEDNKPHTVLEIIGSDFRALDLSI
jgi:single-strand DNA-binding protein